MYIMFIKSSLDPTREIYIGTIEAKINAHRVPAVSNKLQVAEASKSKWPIARVTLRRSPTCATCICIEVFDRPETTCGMVDARTSSALTLLMNGVSVHSLRCNALLKARDRKDEVPWSDVESPVGSASDLRLCLCGPFPS